MAFEKKENEETVEVKEEDHMKILEKHKDALKQHFESLGIDTRPAGEFRAILESVLRQREALEKTVVRLLESAQESRNQGGDSSNDEEETDEESESTGSGYHVDEEESESFADCDDSDSDKNVERLEKRFRESAIVEKGEEK